MKLSFKSFLLGLLVAVLAGCASPPRTEVSASADEPAGAGQTKIPELPFAEPEPGPSELDGDMVFAFLVGEIGAQRGDLETAFGHYLHAAILTEDAYAAERATRIALYLQDREAALRAAEQWTELAPNDMDARRTAALLYLIQDQRDAAMRELQAVLNIAEARGEAGFLQVASALSKPGIGQKGLEVMRELAVDNDQSADYHHALALVEIAAGKLDDALVSLDQEMTLDPESSRAVVLKMRVMVQQGREDEALQDYALALKRFPDDRQLRLNYARLLVKTEQYPRALEQFEELDRRFPEEADSLFAIGVVAMQIRDWDRARSAFQRLRNNPDRHAQATYYLAQVEEETGNLELAIGLYRAIDDDALRMDAGVRLANLLAARGDITQARERFGRLRADLPKQSVELFLAEARMLQNIDYESSAMEVYRDGLQLHPGDIDLLYSRGLYAAQKGWIDLAERDFRLILDAEPDNADALNALGYTLADSTERYDEAAELIRQALRLRPKEAAILDSMGWVLYKQGELEQALAYLQRAIDTTHDSEIAAHLGEVLWQLGRQEEARRVWREALDKDPGHEKLKATTERFP